MYKSKLKQTYNINAEINEYFMRKNAMRTSKFDTSEHEFS
jgi:hypothetical protein